MSEEPSMGMRLETITPKKAMEYLKHNIGNRPMRLSTVKKYKRVMLAGQWALNGDAIRFDTTGRLIDGQKRLQAVVESDVTIQSYVVRNLPPEAFNTIDQNQPRSGCDQFVVAGYKYASVLAAATKLAVWYNEGKPLYEGTVLTDLFEYLNTNPLLHTAAGEASRLYPESRLMAPGPLAFLLFICGRGDKSDSWEASVKFWSAVMVGEGLTKNTPAYVFRKLLVTNKTQRAKVQCREVMCLGIKAWNLHRTNKPCSSLRMGAAEDYPIPVA